MQKQLRLHHTHTKESIRLEHSNDEGASQKVKDTLLNRHSSPSPNLPNLHNAREIAFSFLQVVIWPRLFPPLPTLDPISCSHFGLDVPIIGELRFVDHALPTPRS